MKVEGVLEALVIDGYERILSIRSGDQLICCNAVQPNEYLEPGQDSVHIRVGDLVSADVVLGLAMIRSPRPEEERGLAQDIANSPHAVVVGTIVKKLGDDMYVLDLGQSRELNVELEDAVELSVGARVSVTGELTVHLV